MFRAAAGTLLNEILNSLRKQRKCLEGFNNLKALPTEKMLLTMKGLPEKAQFLKDHTHLFADQCKHDRPSTELLIQAYWRELMGLQWKVGKLLTKAKKKGAPSDIVLYLVELKDALDYCLNQLYFELQMSFGSVFHWATYSSEMATGTNPMPQAWSIPNASPQAPTCSSPLNQPQQLEKPSSLFPAGTSQQVPSEANATALPSVVLSREILSRLESSEFQIQETKTLVTQVLVRIKEKVSLPSQPGKKGPKGKNRQLNFKEQIYVLLLCNFDLLLIQCFGAINTYNFLAFVCGGNERDAADILRNYRKEEDDSSRDPKYTLEGEFDELKTKALKNLGPLPGMILKLVRSQ